MKINISLIIMKIIKLALFSLTCFNFNNKDKETPLAVHIALVIYAETLKINLIDKFHQLGLCISYDPVLQISTDMPNRVCQLYEPEGVVTLSNKAQKICI